MRLCSLAEAQPLCQKDPQASGLPQPPPRSDRALPRTSSQALRGPEHAPEPSFCLPRLSWVQKSPALPARESP
eukprot:CAMPEP_0173394878 /NCGR_PEP_ID=MMETSP1356-20130122/29786_1 /TAXON_ID=77927 ORGANISM="Hemiselmis virescens, Strain PCC157" /NCGR_SAMPLE_ID=MMETSP1356 /ASSEMBLY_ACC=CAM_ASM_000847 /LENGTH=72 /DNA_ID=CAMNT_0014353425 /DNA_START=83 /DNA_END=297 /DNA_ORIENTATION=+